MQLTTAAFTASAVLAVAGTCVALGGLGSIQGTCEDVKYQRIFGSQFTCNATLSVHWVAWALQAALLASVAAAAATQRIHSFRSSLWSAGAVAVALGVMVSSVIYLYMAVLPAGEGVYDAMWAYLVGTAAWVAADILLSFFGDAMYRAKRIEGRDGFVTFRRKPANWQALDEEPQEAAAAAPPASSGLACRAFLASLFVAVAGNVITAGGVGALQSTVCATYGRICNQMLSLYWVAFAMQFCFLAATAVFYAKKQIHNYRTSLWSLAAATTAVSCYLAYTSYDAIRSASGSALTNAKVALAGYCITTAADFLLMLLGDHMYRVQHVLSADGFVSMRRPGCYADACPLAPTGNLWAPQRPLEWAFLGSIVLAFAGTVVALGGLGSAQASCSAESFTYMNLGDKCSTILSFEWWALALQVAVLAATVLAWAKAYVHSFKASLWGLAAVVTFACIISCNLVYAAWPWSTGRTHDSLVATLYGMAVLVAANFLMMVLGDALHHLKREEGEEGYITFKRMDFVLDRQASEPKTVLKV